MPPSQSSNFPSFWLAAPVKAPFSWPKSSDSMRFSGMAAQHLQGLDAGHAAHAVIEQDDVGLVPFRRDDAGFATVRLEDVMPETGQRSAQRVAKVFVIIDDQDFCG